MWALIVAGHIVATFQGHAQCLNEASARAAAGGPRGECMQIQPQQQPDPSMQYLGCVATGACR